MFQLSVGGVLPTPAFVPKTHAVWAKVDLFDGSSFYGHLV